MQTQTATPDTAPKPRRKRKSSRYWNRAPYSEQSDMVAPKHQDKVTGVSNMTTYRLRQRGEFPEPIQVSPGRVAYLRTELVQWREARARAKVGRS